MSEIVLNLQSLPTANVPLKVVRVPLPEIADGMVGYVAQMTADERDERMEALWLKRKEEQKKDPENQVGFRAFIAAASLCEVDGKLNRTNWVAPTEKAINELADKFSGMNGVPISRLFQHAINLNDLTNADVEELEKNSPAAPESEGSGG